MGKIFLTYFWNSDNRAGEPVKAYVKEEDAKAAVAQTKAAKAKFEELYAQLLRPFVCSTCCASKHTDKYPYASKDGKYYDTPEGALYGDKKAEFYALEEIKECRRQNTGEDYYEPIELCE